VKSNEFRKYFVAAKLWYEEKFSNLCFLKTHEGAAWREAGASAYSTRMHKVGFSFDVPCTLLQRRNWGYEFVV
jgi:hypothetical protein